MHESRKAFGGERETETGGSPDSQVIDLAAFLKFPSLSSLFQGTDPNALAKMRSQLTQTNQRLEQVIRQGKKDEADRAVLISRSYKLTLNVLDELERHVAPQAQ